MVAYGNEEGVGYQPEIEHWYARHTPVHLPSSMCQKLPVFYYRRYLSEKAEYFYDGKNKE